MSHANFTSNSPLLPALPCLPPIYSAPASFSACAGTVSVKIAAVVYGFGGRVTVAAVGLNNDFPCVARRFGVESKRRFPVGDFIAAT